MSAEELHQRRTDLLNEQQLELSELDRKQADEQKKIEKKASADWEVKYARAKLDLKDRHYKVRIGLVHRKICYTVTFNTHYPCVFT